MAYCNTFLRNLRLTAWYKRPYVHLTKLPRCLCPFIDVDYSCLSIATQQNRVLQPQKLRFGRWLSSGAPSVTNFCRIAVLRSQACVPKYRGHRSTFAVLCITELRDQVAVAPRSSDMGCYLLLIDRRALLKHRLLSICFSVLFHM